MSVRTGVWFVLSAALALEIVVADGASSLESGEPEVLEATAVGLERIEGRLHLEGEPFTGRLVRRHEGGSVESMTYYRDGLRHGQARAWYASGALRYRRSYRGGREEGVHVGWWEDGSLHFIYAFEDGVHEGNAREWYPDGTPYRDFNYVEGKESGPQRMWHTDGSLRANYVVKDGRRYGLIGSKGCVGNQETNEEVAK